MGYSTNEIAEMMGLKQGAVLTRLHRARTQAKGQRGERMTGEHDNDFEQYQALDLKIAKALQIEVPELNMPELPEIDASEVTPLPAESAL